MKYPTIEKAIVEMAYDNGCISRFQTEDHLKRRVMESLSKEYTTEELDMVEDHLKDLSEEDFDDLICGEQGKIVVHPDVERVLTSAFEEL